MKNSYVKCRYRFNQRWLRWTDGLTLWGRTVYIRRDECVTSSGLFRHEKTHVEQRRRLCVFGWWWTGSVAWLVAYGAAWLWSLLVCLGFLLRALCGEHGPDVRLHRFWGCAYENNRYEREAYLAQHGVAWRPLYHARWRRYD